MVKFLMFIFVALPFQFLAADSSNLAERSYVYFFIPNDDGTAIPRSSLARIVKQTKKTLLQAGKSVESLRVVTLDTAQTNYLECFPGGIGTPQLALLKVISKDGNEIACYTEKRTTWPNDIEISEIVRAL